MDADDPRAYHNAVPGLEHVYLEDSFVLGLTSTVDSLVFAVDLVLTEKHPEYGNPRPNEVHCYRRAKIIISETRAVKWISVNIHPSTDAAGEIDFGSIDGWSVYENHSHIEGPWGDVEVEGGHVQVVLEREGNVPMNTSR